MDSRQESKESSDAAFEHTAQAKYWAIAAIRKAQGKVNPHDVVAGTIAWHRAVVDFANDLRQLLSS